MCQASANFPLCPHSEWASHSLAPLTPQQLNSTQLTKLLKVLILFVPQLGLPEPVPLARSAAKLKCGVHSIGLDLQVLLQALHEEGVAAAKVRNREDADQELAIVTFFVVVGRLLGVVCCLLLSGR